MTDLMPERTAPSESEPVYFPDETTPLRGVDLAKFTLTIIETMPEGWHQSSWRVSSDATRCGAKMCFAGHAADLAGGVWAFDANDDTRNNYMLAEPDDDPVHVFSVRDHGEDLAVIEVHHRAARLLELDEDGSGIGHNLFQGDNSLASLKGAVEEFERTGSITSWCWNCEQHATACTCSTTGDDE